MDGYSFGKYFGEAIVTLAIAGIIGGIAVGVGFSFLIPWLWHHLSIGWS